MKTLILIISTVLASFTSVYGQIIGDSIVRKVSLLDNPEVSALQTDSDVGVKKIIKTQGWKPLDSTCAASAKKDLWIKFEITNSSEDTIFKYVLIHSPKTIIYQGENLVFEEFTNGYLVPLHKRANASEDFFTKLSFAPFRISQIFIRVKAPYNFSTGEFPQIFSERAYIEASEEIKEYQIGSIGFIYFYIISLLTIIIFASVFWFRLRENLYLYYLGYLFFQLIYGFMVLKRTVASVGNFFNYIPKLMENLFEPVQFIFITFYIFFILHLLKIKQNHRFLAKTLWFLGIFCLFYAGLRFVFSYYFFDPEITTIFFTTVRVIIFPINLILIVWIILKVKHPLLGYFILGQSFFFIGALIASYLGYTGLHYLPGNFFHFMEAPNIIFQAGLLAEVYCFSIALGQNIFLLQKEKNNTNIALIEQFRRNRLLQEEMNRDLDEKVNKKTTELIELYTQLERQKEREIKADFTRKLKEMEMIALRSQMNPHFLFNSLNAIKHLIMTSRNDDATEYLDNFSIMLRGILQNSNKEIITVEEELDILELYLSLEKSRLGENFNYSIKVISKEALSQFYIPPLLLQPFAENAIWHGLNPSNKKEKNLSVILDTTQNLKIIIEDNGIGRNANRKIEKFHKSMGMEITKERLTLFNYLNTPSIHLEIADLGNTETPLGTRITLAYSD